MSTHRHHDAPRHDAPHPARPPLSLYGLGAAQRLALAGLLACLMWLAVWAAIG